MLVELTRLAETDVAEAAVAYELERPGLGSRFDAEIERVLSRVADNAMQFPVLSDGVRRALLRVFPYAVYFILVGDRARVFAVLHQHRHPDARQRER